MKKASGHESGGEKVPLWIISFADMITLLLSFFVMLQTMAKSQDATLFGVSQDSFRRAIAGFGLPELLLGRGSAIQMDYKKLKYPTDQVEPDQVEHPPPRIIDADDAKIRQLFESLKSQMDVEAADVGDTLAGEQVMPVHFEPAQAQLDARSVGAIADLAAQLKHDLRPADCKISVLAAAGDEPGPRQQYLLSARRAQAIESVLKGELCSTGVSPVSRTATGGTPVLPQPGGPWQISARGVGAGHQLRKYYGGSGQDACAVIIVTRSRT